MKRGSGVWFEDINGKKYLDFTTQMFACYLGLGNEEIAEAVKETIAKASPGGGHILASSNGIHPAVNPLNYRTMLEACKRHGQYPLDEKMVESYKSKDYYAQYRGEAVDES